MACQHNTSTWKGLSEYRSSSRDCQNKVMVVGDHAVELERYYPRKKFICNDLLGSVKEFRGRFLRDISMEKATNFVPFAKSVKEISGQSPKPSM